jgi:DNA processing protein
LDKLNLLLFLKGLKGIGNSAINKHFANAIHDNVSIEEIRDKLYKMNYSDKDIDLAIDKAADAYDLVKSHKKINAITIFDKDYPAKLNNLGNKKPPIIYVKGDKKVLSKPFIAVIGTRNPTQYAKNVGEQLVKKTLTITDDVIVSGLALGCDAIAHDVTLKTGRITCAVLPSGFNKIVPKQHIKLAEEIVSSRGCLITEYLPNSEATKYTYIERDSIVAALSFAVIVIQCDVESGTMHTVDAAKSMKKNIGCYIPSEKEQNGFEGNYYIVKEKQGLPLREVDDIKKLMESCTVFQNQEQMKFDW